LTVPRDGSPSSTKITLMASTQAFSKADQEGKGGECLQKWGQVGRQEEEDRKGQGKRPFADDSKKGEDPEEKFGKKSLPSLQKKIGKHEQGASEKN